MLPKLLGLLGSILIVAGGGASAAQAQEDVPKFTRREFKDPGCISFSFTDGGKSLAMLMPGVVSGQEFSVKPKLHIEDLARVKPRESFACKDWSGVFACSPDGKIIAAGVGAELSNEKTIQLWDRAAGKLMAQFEGHEKRVSELVFSPDGRTLVSCSYNSGRGGSEVLFWDVAKGKKVATIDQTRTGIFHSVHFSPDGKTIAFAGHKYGNVNLWNVTEQKLAKTLQYKFKGYGAPMAFSPDSKKLAIANGPQLSVWDVAEGKAIVTWDAKPPAKPNFPSIRGPSFSTDGKLLACGGYGADVQIWRAEDGKLLISLDSGFNTCRRVGFSPDGRMLFFSGDLKKEGWATAPGTSIGQSSVMPRAHPRSVFPLWQHSDTRATTAVQARARDSKWDFDRFNQMHRQPLDQHDLLSGNVLLLQQPFEMLDTGDGVGVLQRVDDQQDVVVLDRLLRTLRKPGAGPGRGNLHRRLGVAAETLV